MSRALASRRVLAPKLTRSIRFTTARYSSTTSAAAVSGGGNEQTFRSFTREDGLNYLKFRRGYHPQFYETVLEQHTSTGGQLGSILDVGTGPGIVVRALAAHFDEATGLDQSEGMLKAARAIEASEGTLTRAGRPIRFEFSPAEELGRSLSPPVVDSSIDLVTSASAVHWFDMQRFYRAAARVLRPGGTLALWNGRHVISSSTPNSQAVQAAFDEMETGPLDEYTEPGNRLANDLYRDLLLPWTVPEPVREFEEGAFRKLYWTTEGEEANATAEEFLVGTRVLDLDMVEKIFGTTASVVRWREKNLDKVGTERDVVRRTRRNVEKILREAGQRKGEESLVTGYKAVLLIAKRT